MLRNTPVDMYALSAALSKEQCIPLKMLSIGVLDIYNRLR